MHWGVIWVHFTILRKYFMSSLGGIHLAIWQHKQLNEAQTNSAQVSGRYTLTSLWVSVSE